LGAGRALVEDSGLRLTLKGKGVRGVGSGIGVVWRAS